MMFEARKRDFHQTGCKTSLAIPASAQLENTMNHNIDRPIFLLGLSRGGTNQALNILRSHPATFWPKGEFGEIFSKYPRGASVSEIKRMLFYTPILLTSGDIFNPGRSSPPRKNPWPSWRARLMQSALLESATRQTQTVRDFKGELTKRGFIDSSATPSRFVIKLINYNLHLIQELAEFYPRATFVGLIRDGRAVCEGQMARGKSLCEAMKLYNFVGSRLIGLSSDTVNFKTWRFEDLCGDPVNTIMQIYRFCDLTEPVRGVHLEDKTRIYAERAERPTLKKVSRYLPLNDVGAHFRLNVNEESIGRLSWSAKEQIEDGCGEVLRHYNYMGKIGAPARLQRPPPGSV